MEWFGQNLVELFKFKVCFTSKFRPYTKTLEVPEFILIPTDHGYGRTSIPGIMQWISEGKFGLRGISKGALGRVWVFNIKWIGPKLVELFSKMWWAAGMAGVFYYGLA